MEQTKKKIKFFIMMAICVIIATVIYKIIIVKPQDVVLNIISKTGSSDDIFELARQNFMKNHPNIKINYISKSTFDAIDYIMKGNEVNAWLCADETAAEILNERFQTENKGSDLVLETRPIVASPLVLVGWEERLKFLGDISVSTLYDLVSNGKTWKDIGGDENWGFMNFSHTDAIKSNSGIQFIQLLIYDYYSSQNQKKKSLEVKDIADNKLMEYLEKFEKNSSTKEEGTGKFIQDFVLYGPSRCDLGAVYEYYALSNIQNAQGKWGNLKIIYPNPTIWSNKPFVILGGKSSKEQIAASREFMKYLLSKEVQETAMKNGYRPGNSEITDMGIMENKFAKFGYKKDISQAVPPPSIDVVETIRTMMQKIN